MTTNATVSVNTLRIALVSLFYAAYSGPNLTAQISTKNKNGDFVEKIGSLTVHYSVQGNGQVCLVIPSMASQDNYALYSGTLKSLETVFTMVYFDPRGCGKSQFPTDSSAFTLKDFRNDIDSLRIHLGQSKVWIIGHADGGSHAIDYCASHPNNVFGVICIATPQSFGSSEHQMEIFNAIKSKNKKLAVKPNHGGELKYGNDEELKTSYLEGRPMLWANPARFDVHKLAFQAGTMSCRFHRSLIEHRPMPLDVTKDVAELTNPVLFLVGDDDVFCSIKTSKRLKDLTPNSKLTVILDCGHYPWLEQSKSFTDEVKTYMKAKGESHGEK